MAKQRLYYLDFVRALSTLIIVLTHYNALYIYNAQNPRAFVICAYPFNIYIGSLGASLFLIISGASLYLTYGNADKFDFKKFYTRRFLGIYPMFWVGFIVVSLINFIESKGGSISGIPRRNIIFSVLGIDGLASSFGIKTFYRVGEWFLGFIILFYVIFPFVLLAVKKWPVISAVVCLAMYTATLLLGSKYSLSMLISTRLPEIMFGMYFIKYFKQGNVRWYVALASLAVLVLNEFLAPDHIDGNIQVTYVGVCAFLLLVYVSKFFKFAIARNICDVICKYSYPCFIIHHYVTFKVVEGFDLANMGRLNSYILFTACLVAVCIASWMLYAAEKAIMGALLKKRADEGSDNTKQADTKPAEV